MIHFAPFFGEFGWEVAMWIPWMRGQIVNFFKGVDVKIVCREGHEPLYKILLDKNVHLRTMSAPQISRYDCQNIWVHGYSLVDKTFYHKLLCDLYREKIPPKSILCPLDMSVLPDSMDCPKPRDAVYDPYCESVEIDRDLIAVHARMYNEKQPEKNWSQSNWDELVSKLADRFRFVAVGLPSQAYSPRGAFDARAIGLDEQMRQMAQAICIVGPSSGPLHLANFCGTRAIWWGDCVSKFDSAWNPFSCRNRQVEKGWNPSVSEVYKVLKTVR